MEIERLVAGGATHVFPADDLQRGQASGRQGMATAAAFCRNERPLGWRHLQVSPISSTSAKSSKCSDSLDSPKLKPVSLVSLSPYLQPVFFARGLAGLVV